MLKSKLKCINKLLLNSNAIYGDYNASININFSDIAVLEFSHIPADKLSSVTFKSKES